MVRTERAAGKGGLLRVQEGTLTGALLLRLGRRRNLALPDGPPVMAVAARPFAHDDRHREDDRRDEAELAKRALQKALAEEGPPRLEVLRLRAHQPHLPHAAALCRVRYSERASTRSARCGELLCCLYCSHMPTANVEKGISFIAFDRVCRQAVRGRSLCPLAAGGRPRSRR